MHPSAGILAYSYGEREQTRVSPAGIPQAPIPPALSVFWATASVASSGAGAYHGYKRNKSVGWAVWWAVMGGLFPVITPAIAVAQGFGKPIKR